MSDKLIYSNYRKIWVDANGPIPIDSDGRSYEIHHINGNRNDNCLENLACLKIKNHYKVHFEQGDFGACYAIALRMNQDQGYLKKLSELSKKTQQRRLEEGTHNFLDSNKNRENAIRRVENGTHHFLSGEIQKRNNRKRVEEGTHNFIGGTLQKNRVQDRTHHFLSGEIQRKSANERVKKGTHHLLESVTCRDLCGNVVQIASEIYKRQDKSKPVEQIEFVHVRSKEGKRRKILK